VIISEFSGLAGPEPKLKQTSSSSGEVSLNHCPALSKLEFHIRPDHSPRKRTRHKSELQLSKHAAD